MDVTVKLGSNSEKITLIHQKTLGVRDHFRNVIKTQQICLNIKVQTTHPTLVSPVHSMCLGPDLGEE